MKKIFSLLIVVVILLSLSSCGDKRVELTVDNIKHYINLDAIVADCNVEAESGSVMGIKYKNYRGDAKIEVNAVNQSGAKFENVIIECELYTHLETYPAKHGWEFNNGNRNSGTDSYKDTNTKKIRIVLPYDGNWSHTESLSFVMYDEGRKFLASPLELSYCYLNILSVSGTAVGGKPNIPQTNDTQNEEVEEEIMYPMGDHPMGEE